MQSRNSKFLTLKTVIFITALIFNHFVAIAQDKTNVYIFLSETCPICKNATLELNKLHNQYVKYGYSFIGLFPNESISTVETRASFAKKYRLDFPLVRDTNQHYTKKFSATITPEVIVWSEPKQKMFYRGKIDNSFESVGKRRTVTTEFYLRNALESILKNTSESITFTQPVGCFIQTKNEKHEH